MIRILNVQNLVTLAFLFAVAPLTFPMTFADPSPPTLADDFRHAQKLLRDRSSLEAGNTEQSIRTWLADKTIVLISGFMDDILPQVFQHNIEALRRDFDFQNVILIRPFSGNSVDENAIVLSAQLEQIRTSSPDRKLVVFAASKGAAEVILMLLSEPNWIESGRIHRVVGIQSAVNGTPLADVVTPKCDVDSDNWRCRLFDSTPITRVGLASLTEEHMRSSIGAKLALLSPETRALFANRLFYVRAHQSIFRVGEALKLTWHINQIIAGDNDGMIITREQYLQEVGTDLGILNSDHAGLFGSPLVSNEKYEFKEAFMWTLLKRLAESETPSKTSL